MNLDLRPCKVNWRLARADSNPNEVVSFVDWQRHHQVVHRERSFGVVLEPYKSHRAKLPRPPLKERSCPTITAIHQNFSPLSGELYFFFSSFFVSRHRSKVGRPGVTRFLNYEV